METSLISFVRRSIVLFANGLSTVFKTELTVVPSLSVRRGAATEYITLSRTLPSALSVSTTFCLTSSEKASPFIVL